MKEVVLVGEEEEVEDSVAVVEAEEASDRETMTVSIIIMEDSTVGVHVYFDLCVFTCIYVLLMLYCVCTCAW